MMKKMMILSLALISLIALVRTPSADKSGVLRLHVIANSDSQADQTAKLMVRDAILEYERGRMTAYADAGEARRGLMADGAGLMAAIEGALRNSGSGYGAQLRLGNYEFPDRDYAGEYFPAGTYSALRVILGEGQGANWWCVMFPPLCILELPNGEVDYNKLKTNSFIVNLIKGIDGGKLWRKLEAKLGITHPGEKKN